MLAVLSTIGLWAQVAQGAPSVPLYAPQPLTQTDLAGHTLRELTLMRNTIFARAGHRFRKKWLADYFTAQPWYHARAKDDESVITPTDRDNAALIATYEGGLPREELLRRRGAVLERKNAGRGTPEDAIELRLLSQHLGEWSVGKDDDTAATERSPLEDPSVLDQLLSVKQLDNLSRRDLRLLRNTIYARHGRPFKSLLLQSYFNDMAWYHESGDYSDKQLSDVDRRNIKLVRSVEDTLGGPLSDDAHKKEDGWFLQA